MADQGFLHSCTWSSTFMPKAPHSQRWHRGSITAMQAIAKVEHGSVF